MLSPVGPALHEDGGSRPRSANSCMVSRRGGAARTLLIRFIAILDNRRGVGKNRRDSLRRLRGLRGTLGREQPRFLHRRDGRSRRRAGRHACARAGRGVQRACTCVGTARTISVGEKCTRAGALAVARTGRPWPRPTALRRRLVAQGATCAAQVRARRPAILRL